jgi:hypothetical protein
MFYKPLLPAKAALLFEDSSPSPSPIHNNVYSRGFPHSVLIFLIATILSVFALVLMMSIIHFTRLRTRCKLQARQQADVEKSLQLSRRLVLVIDTDIPRANELQRYANATRLVMRVQEGDISTAAEYIGFIWA